MTERTNALRGTDGQDSINAPPPARFDSPTAEVVGHPRDKCARGLYALVALTASAALIRPMCE